MLKNKNKVRTALLAILLLGVLISASPIAAQTFQGSAVLGFNLAQIDGDDLYGYNKVGLSGGFKLTSPVHRIVDVSLEMLYSERGSTAGFGFSGLGVTSLKYLELPMMVVVKDWHIEDGDYFKVSAHGGLSLGYLFDVSSENGQYAGDIDNFKRIDLSYFVGVNYRFNRRLGFTLRHTRAFTSLLTSTAISYFITLRTEYNF